MELEKVLVVRICACKLLTLSRTLESTYDQVIARTMNLLLLVVVVEKGLRVSGVRGHISTI